MKRQGLCKRVLGRRHVDTWFSATSGLVEYAHRPLNQALQYPLPHSIAVHVLSVEQRSLHASQSPFDWSRNAQSTFSLKSAQSHPCLSHGQTVDALIATS